MRHSTPKNTAKEWQNQDLKPGILVLGLTLLNIRGVYLISENKRLLPMTRVLHSELAKRSKLFWS